MAAASILLFKHNLARKFFLGGGNGSSNFDQMWYLGYSYLYLGLYRPFFDITPINVLRYAKQRKNLWGRGGNVLKIDLFPCSMVIIIIFKNPCVRGLSNYKNDTLLPDFLGRWWRQRRFEWPPFYKFSSELGFFLKSLTPNRLKD